MRRLIVVAGLCVAAFAATPTASASAAFEGKCKITGVAQFKGKELKAENQTKLKYNFFSEKHENLKTEIVPGVECIEGTTERGEKAKAGAGKVGATVTGGKFEGSCVGPGVSEEDGKGELKLWNKAETAEETLKFDLDFTSLGGTVTLKVELAGEAAPEGAPQATGEADFKQSKKQLAAECAVGVKELQFEATVNGKVA